MAHSVVIGGAGFVGSWVVEEILKSHDSKVTIIDNLISSERWNVSSDQRVTFIEGSASDLETFQKIRSPIDFIYQLACFHGNQSSIAQPLNDFEYGLKSTLVTLEWAKKNAPHARIVYSGAGCAVAEKTWGTPSAIEEIDTTSLIHDSPYSISKITGEMYCLYYRKLYNLDIVRVRFQNVYGPREILGAGRWRGTRDTIWRNVVPIFIYKAINAIPIEVNPLASRDFIYVEDLAKGVIAASEKGRSGEVYNLASGNETMIIDLAKKILLHTDSKSDYVEQPKRNWDSSGRRLADTKKSTRELQFTALTNLDEGLKKTIDWTQSHLELIETCIHQHRERL
jgi:UDP-glucose 4-epimerase